MLWQAKNKSGPKEFIYRLARLESFTVGKLDTQESTSIKGFNKDTCLIIKSISLFCYYSFGSSELFECTTCSLMHNSCEKSPSWALTFNNWTHKNAKSPNKKNKHKKQSLYWSRSIQNTEAILTWLDHLYWPRLIQVTVSTELIYNAGSNPQSQWWQHTPQRKTQNFKNLTTWKATQLISWSPHNNGLLKKNVFIL